MPWIKKMNRIPLENPICELTEKLNPEEAGNLTYVLYELPLRVWVKKKCWGTACLILGAMLGAMLCFFVKHVWKYELTKVVENGETDGDLAADR